jgi:hypothetical protein
MKQFPPRSLKGEEKKNYHRDTEERRERAQRVSKEESFSPPEFSLCNSPLFLRVSVVKFFMLKLDGEEGQMQLFLLFVDEFLAQ